VSRILCFGDSLTAGYLAPTGVILVRAIPESYPTQLQQMLASRYRTQTFVVENAGQVGEWADDGQLRIVSTTRSLRPEAVVLMEGANDLNGLGPRGVTVALEALENMLRDARALGARVLLASLPPQRPGSRLGGGAALINEFNSGIRSLAGRQEVLFVDVHAAFAGDLSLIGPDGLHPTAAGYQRMAQAVFDVLRANFERAPAPTP
jgi:lysophospholipase L1-like esterase